MGKVFDRLDFYDYMGRREYLKKVISGAYRSLDAEYDIIVIEGAGSPAEINLKKEELANMSIAKMANAPVILVGDIDRGGVFASLVGTLELLEPEERNRIKGFIINKFRGDLSLLKPGLDFLEEKTCKPVLGVIPMITSLNLPEEDSAGTVFRDQPFNQQKTKEITIGIVDMPHISNISDYNPFLAEPDVQIFMTRKPQDLDNADIVILPGSKNVSYDINVLKKEGFGEKIQELNQWNKMIVGICGGYQMLGKTIQYPKNVESPAIKIDGFGLLDMETVFNEEKYLSQTRAVFIWENMTVNGYEIHHGKSDYM